MAEPIKIPVILQHIGSAAGMVGGAAAGAAGAAGSAGSRVQGAMFGSGGPGEVVKGLGQIAKQLPGAGMMEGMASAFKQGGPIGVITAGVSGMLGFVKSIMESSKVFQGIAGSFFKIFGAMADVFLLPFLPLAMKGMQELLKHMPRISEWGQKAADWVMKIFNFVQGEGLWGAIKHGVGLGVDKIQQVLNDMWGAIQKWLGIDPETTAAREQSKAERTGEEGATLSTAEQSVLGVAGGIDALTGGVLHAQGGVEWGMEQMWSAQGRHRGLDARTDPMYNRLYGGSSEGITEKNMSDEMMMEYLSSGATNVEDFLKNRRQLGGRVPGGPGQGVPAILHGGEEVIPRDVVSAMEAAQGGVLGGFFGTMGEQIFEQSQKINNYVAEFKAQEGGAAGVIGMFDSTVLEGDIPNIWNGIDDYLTGIGTQTRDAANAANSLDFTNLADFDVALDLPEFQPPQGVFDELQMCFMTLQTCINANLEAMPVAVQNEAGRIQDMLSEASGLIAAGRGDEVDFEIIGDAIMGLDGSIQGHIGSLTSNINQAANEISAIMGMSYQEFKNFDEGSFWGAANYFGTTGQQAGIYLTSMREIAANKTPPCTAAQIEDPSNGRCFEGCKDKTYHMGHPCWTPPPIQDEPPPPLPPEVFEEDEPDEPIDYGPGDNVPSGIHLPYDSGGGGQQSGQGALGPGGPGGFTGSQASGIHQAVQSYSSPSGGFNYGGGPGGRGFYAGGIVPGRTGAPRMVMAHGGERIMPNSSPGSSRAATSHRVMNVIVNARGGLAEVLGELQRFEDLDEASFFNSVL